MFISYFDESGDDGFPNYSSPLFALTAIYFPETCWKDFHNTCFSFRQHLRNSFGIPVREEIHTKYFLLNKDPYRKLGLPNPVRVEIITQYCQLISHLGCNGLQSVNVVINKTVIRKADYKVLDRALTYSIQRIENDLIKDEDEETKFLMIIDPGREGKMRKTARRVQIINYIPSKIYPGTSYRKEIFRLIEDPLPKDSTQSHFIQIADFIAYLIYQYKFLELQIGSLPNRMPTEVDSPRIISWLEIIKPCLNLEASGEDPYGVVCYPK